jgi:hypothetical protein
MRRAFCQFAYIAGFIALSVHAVPASKPPFSVTLNAPDKDLKSGAELHLLVTIKNTSDHDIPFITNGGPPADDGYRYKVEVVKADAHEAPPSALVIEMRSGKKLVVTHGNNIGRKLKPGDSLLDQIDVTKLYDLSQPGIYTISVTRPLEPYQGLGKGAVRSNTIAVTVVK